MTSLLLFSKIGYNNLNSDLFALPNAPYKNSLFLQNKETQEIIAIGGLRLLTKYCPKTDEWITMEELLLNDYISNEADIKFYGHNGLCIIHIQILFICLLLINRLCIDI